MKANRIIDHRQRIRRVAAFIDEHIDGRLNLQSLAAVACLSPFHFQRIYHQLVGETPAETVRRLRLTRAATQIAQGEVSVTEAAAFAGYGSSQAFCRAFRRRFGVAPSRLKKLGRAWLIERQPEEPDFSLLQLPAQIGYGLRYAGPDWEGDWSSCQVVGRAFADGLWSPPDSALFMQYRTDPFGGMDGHVDAEICLVGNDDKFAALGFERVVMPGGSYAVLRLSGALRNAMTPARALLHKRLGETGLVRRAAPVLRRVVKDMALTPPSEWFFDLYVPVEPRRVVSADHADREPQASETSRDLALSTAL
jgi:AraC family transcriptional regulator